MQITAKIIQLLPLQTGTGKNGEWKKQDVIVETEGQYPKKICLSVWGDKIKEEILQTGQKFHFSVEIESQEYNGKWYTNVKAWKIEEVSVNTVIPTIGITVIKSDNISNEESQMPF
jgi:hypothetical protein